MITPNIVQLVHSNLKADFPKIEDTNTEFNEEDEGFGDENSNINQPLIEGLDFTKIT